MKIQITTRNNPMTNALDKHGVSNLQDLALASKVAFGYWIVQRVDGRANEIVLTIEGDKETLDQVSHTLGVLSIYHKIVD